MKKVLRSKLAIGIIFFCLGFFVSQFLSRVAYRSTIQMLNSGSTVHIPVNPRDFDHDKLMDAAQRMRTDLFIQDNSEATESNVAIAEVQRREDNQYVYYDIPLTSAEKNDRELKINVKDGIISIIENTKNVQSMREIAIEPGLDEAHSKVENHDDKLSIRLPKKATI